MKKMQCLLLIVACLMLSSCKQKEFDNLIFAKRCHIEVRATYDKCWHLVYEGGTDWSSVWDEDLFLMSYESLMPIDPEGLRVIAYKDDKVEEYYNLEPNGGRIDLAPGAYTFTLFNNDTEYIIFNDIDREAEATATTRQRSRDTYSSNNSDDEYGYIINPPDMLYACNEGSIECKLENDNMIMECQLRPLVYKYLVRYHFNSGIHHISMARGAISGMASSVFLTDGHTPEDKATIMYDMDMESCRVKTNSSTGEGMLYTVVNTFGAPGYPNNYYSRVGDSYYLKLDTLLTNGKELSFNVDITDQIQKQPRGGIIEVYGLEVTDQDAAESTGSFDVDIEGWAPNESYDIM